jgi:hypothetical protein
MLLVRAGEMLFQFEITVNRAAERRRKLVERRAIHRSVDGRRQMLRILHKLRLQALYLIAELLHASL